MARLSKTVEVAYCKVYGISTGEVKQKIHQNRIKEALEKVWMYPGYFPNETEASKELRLELTSPANGEYADLAAYFKSLPGNNEFQDMLYQEIIFTIYKRMNDTEEATDESVTASTDEVENTVDSDTKNYTQHKEENEMGNAIDQIKELEQGLGATAGTDIVTASQPQVDQISLKAASDAVRANEKERITTSQTALIEKFIVNAQPKTVRAVAGENSVGTIRDPKTTFANFVKKTGAVEDANGTVSFPNVPEDVISVQQAKAIYDVLKRAADGEKIELKANVSDAIGTIKGYRLITKKGGEYKLCNKEEMVDFLLAKTVGVLNTPVQGVQVSQSTAAPNSKKNSAGKKSGKATKGAGHMTTVRVAGRKEAAENGLFIYVNTVTDKVVTKGGFTSEMGCKIYGKKLDENGNKKTVSYHIPLDVEQYEVEIKDPELREKFPKTAPGGRTATIIDLSNNDAAMSALQDLSTAMANLMAMGATGNLFDKIQENIDKAHTAEQKAQAEDLPM